MLLHDAEQYLSSYVRTPKISLETTPKMNWLRNIATIYKKKIVISVVF